MKVNRVHLDKVLIAGAAAIVMVANGLLSIVNGNDDDDSLPMPESVVFRRKIGFSISDSESE